jgi:glycosyltransferase involved in cell wall biosynthesis
LISKPEYIYIAFDLFPSQKGAATHINHCLKALQNTYKTGLLICLGNDDMPRFQYDKERRLYVYRWKEKIVNFLERTQAFQKSVTELLLSDLCTEVKLIHFRDIWGGLPVLNTIHKQSQKTVFEVNAFASIELPNRYPNISQSVIAKIKAIEQFCIANCNTIITPSKVTKQYILNTYKTKVSLNVIPNGVSIYKAKKLTQDQTPYILYFGALQKWQGIKTLFKAFKELEAVNVRLMICASVSEKRALSQKELAEAIGVAHSIDWFYELDKEALASKIVNALFTVAPLALCDRNLVQGCNPLKIIESLAYGVPVVASNIPVVKELIEDCETGFLVDPDRPEALGRKMRTLIEQPEQVQNVGEKGEKHILENYLWKHQEQKMKTLYLNL